MAAMVSNPMPERRVIGTKWTVYGVGRTVGSVPFNKHSTYSVTREFLSMEDAQLYLVKTALNVRPGYALSCVLVEVNIEEWVDEYYVRRTNSVNTVLQRIGDGKCWDGQ